MRLAQVSGTGRVGLLTAVYFATFLISNVVTNNAAAALMFPIAAEAAARVSYAVSSAAMLVDVDSYYTSLLLGDTREGPTDDPTAASVHLDADIAYRIPIEPHMVALVQTTVAQQPKIRAVLLECTELPPYADAIRKATKLPVLDVQRRVRVLAASEHIAGLFEQ